MIKGAPRSKAHNKAYYCRDLSRTGHSSNSALEHCLPTVRVDRRPDRNTAGDDDLAVTDEACAGVSSVEQERLGERVDAVREVDRGSLTRG